MLRPLFPDSVDNYEYIRNMVGVVEDLPIEWESKLEGLRLISEQDSTLEKAPTTAIERNKDLAVIEMARTKDSDPADCVASAKEGPGLKEYLAKDGTSSKGLHISSTPQ